MTVEQVRTVEGEEGEEEEGNDAVAARCGMVIHFLAVQSES